MNKHPRRFQYSWFNIFPNWLEYSPTTHASYCFICYIFNDKPSVCHGYDDLIIGKKLMMGKLCVLVTYRNVVAFVENLMNQATHIENIIVKQNEAQMRGEWNGLQALVLKDCPYAYYVHCFAHRLQLALVATSREIIPVHQFFTNLLFTINVVCASGKRHDELQKAKANEIEQLLELGEIESATLDKQLYELNNRFNDQVMKLLSLSPTLVSKVINIDQICRLVEKYYPEDLTEQERIQLRYQLEIFNIDMTKNPRLSGVSTIAELCKRLVETQKLVRLILTLPVSTATTERRFSAIKIFKNRLRNKMSDDFLANNLVIYIEREIAENIDSKSVIDEFKDIKGRQTEFL
uniref:TTF-type domain-containing protein n=1 Tax=Lactuca sativa TaxID=4236 RepID=A0A9R1UCP4_LACSA|nr:hypothetical protein LSAT_V11C900476850 [Lactuca sativa]